MSNAITAPWTSDMLHTRAAILREPASDVLRQMFADQLSDRGEPGDEEWARDIRYGVEFPKWDGAISTADSNAAKAGILSEHKKRAISVMPTDSVWWAMFHKGFVSEIRLPLAAFVGGVCGECGGRGGWASGLAAVNCPVCDGLRRTPGHAAAIFKAHPVTRVVLADRGPIETAIRSRHMWHRGDPSAQAFTLPAEIYNRLPPPEDAHESLKVARFSIVSYPTLDSAIDAHSAACVAYARELAGLPPLEAIL